MVYVAAVGASAIVLVESLASLLIRNRNCKQTKKVYIYFYYLIMIKWQFEQQK